jgi:hypothetical protein
MNKVFVVMPVHGRLPLLKHTITRLLKKNGVYHVICVGWEAAEKRVCENAGAEFILHKNILGSKLNAGFEIAGIEGATHILFTGSSDFVTKNFIETLLPLCPENGFVGTRGFYQAHIEKNGNVKAGYWKGYPKGREFEPIGIGRIVSRKALELCNFRPFLSSTTHSMDGQMYNTVIANNGNVVFYEGKEAFSLSISTDQWINLHRYGDKPDLFTEIKEPRTWLKTHFPETLKIF